MNIDFDKNKAIEMLSAELTCLNRQVNPNKHCGDCDNCILLYQQGHIGDKIALLKALLNALVD